jgi:16S rRNA (guanine527-N7)-methyltransferase
MNNIDSKVIKYLEDRFSNEIIANLQEYAKTLLKWNQTINLIGESTVEEIWTRHILDSVQLYDLIKKDAKILTDFGSGAGLPGAILAIVGVPEVHLIESDKRKASFLRDIAHLASGRLKVHSKRAEKLEPWASDIITARAFADLDLLLEYSYPFMQKNCFMLLLKGSKLEEEIELARHKWEMAYSIHPSITNNTGLILEISNLCRKE